MAVVRAVRTPTRRMAGAYARAYAEAGQRSRRPLPRARAHEAAIPSRASKTRTARSRRETALSRRRSSISQRAKRQLRPLPCPLHSRSGEGGGHSMSRSRALRAGGTLVITGLATAYILWRIDL